MSDEATPAAAHEKEMDGGADEAAKRLRERRHYVTTRIAKAREEIAACTDEQGELRRAIKEGRDVEQRKNLVRKRAYATHRIAALKGELRALALERERLAGELKGESAAGAPDDSPQIEKFSSKESDALQQILLRAWGRSPKPEDIERLTARIVEGQPARAFIKKLAESEPFIQNRQVRCHNPAGHFYSPVVDPELVKDYYDRSSAETALAGVALSLPQMEQFWNDNSDYIRSTPFADASGENRYGYLSGPFAYGDAITLRAMIHHFRPRRIIEIGSGASSVCMLDSLEHAGIANCSVACIEPYPERLRRLMREGDPVVIRELPVQSVALDTFRALRRNDILFIDSSHVLKTGSDVHYELFNILPILRPGVVIHFHDCRYPFEYSRIQVFQKNYSWNEVYAVRALLMYSTRFRVIFWGSYFAQERRDLVQSTLPDFLKNPGSSLWLQVQDDGAGGSET